MKPSIVTVYISYTHKQICAGTAVSSLPLSCVALPACPQLGDRVALENQSTFQSKYIVFPVGWHGDLLPPLE